MHPQAEALLASLLFVSVVAPHTCVHDALLAQNPHLWQSRSAPAVAYKDGGRRLSTSTWAPIRITPIFQNLAQDPLMTPALAAYVENTLVPTAIQRWAALLSVQPVQANLFFYKPCAAYWESSSPWLCAQLANATCAIGDGVTVNISAAFLATETVYPVSPPSSPVSIPGGPGLPSSDFGLIVTAIQTSYCGSGGEGTLAYGYTCNRDQYDRPIWGRINFCTSALSASAYNWNQQLGVATHEIAHALGYSATSWPLFRTAAGAPMTPRDTGIPSNPSAAYAVSYSCGGVENTVYTSTTSTVQYFSERGMTACNPTSVTPATASNCVAKLVTPSAIAAAQWYTGCSTLNGAELENQLTTACSIVGSHWEQRIFSTELMASYAQHALRLTPLTAAALEDSGWYKATYNGTDWFRPGSDYGFQQGCAFATGKCLLTQNAATGQGAPPHYYGSSRSSNTNNPVCTTDNLAIGYTAVQAYAGALPSQYQYFTNTAEGGAPPNVFDYCPAVQAYTNTQCARSADADTNAAYYGETYGASSACMASTLIWTGLVSATGPGAACFAVSCPGDGSLHITVTAGSGQPTSSIVTCVVGSAGQTFGVAGYLGTVTCPNPAVICGAAQKYLGPGVSPTSTPAPWPFQPGVPSASAAPLVSSSASVSANPSTNPAPSAAAARAADSALALPALLMSGLLGLLAVQPRD